MRTHALTETDLPHIAVIDSRTGAKIVTVKGFVAPGDLAMILLEYLESARCLRTLPFSTLRPSPLSPSDLPLHHPQTFSALRQSVPSDPPFLSFRSRLLTLVLIQTLRIKPTHTLY